MRRSGAERRRTCFVYPPPCYQQSGVTPLNARSGVGYRSSNSDLCAQNYTVAGNACCELPYSFLNSVPGNFEGALLQETEADKCNSALACDGTNKQERRC